jgi:hypothetical protein
MASCISTYVGETSVPQVAGASNEAAAAADESYLKYNHFTVFLARRGKDNPCGGNDFQ